MLRQKIWDVLLAAVIAVAANAVFLAMMFFFLESDGLPTGNNTVYTTPTGECYHLASCSSLSNSKYETTIRAAVQNGFRSCSNCNAPVLKEEEGFRFNFVHYLVVVPFTAMCAYAGAGDVIDKACLIGHPPYLVHLAISALLSLGFDMII